MNLEIVDETEEGFVTVVVENYLVNLGGMGFHFTSHAEDTYREIADEVYEMLRKKIYGHSNVNVYRTSHREQPQREPGQRDQSQPQPNQTQPFKKAE